jgi:hypothetical protein
MCTEHVSCFSANPHKILLTDMIHSLMNGATAKAVDKMINVMSSEFCFKTLLIMRIYVKAYTVKQVEVNL